MEIIDSLSDLCIDITAAFEGNTLVGHANGQSVGLLGWRGDWLHKLRQYAAERNAPYTDWAIQRRFARDHFDYTYNRSIAPRGISSAIGTAAIFDSCINFGNNHRLLMRTDQQLGLSQARDIYSYRPRDIRGVIAERDYIQAFTALAYEAVEAAGNPEAVQQRWAWWAAISAAWLGFDEEINIRGHKVAVPPAYQDAPHTPQNAPDAPVTPKTPGRVANLPERPENAASALVSPVGSIIVLHPSDISFGFGKAYPNSEYMRRRAANLIGKVHNAIDVRCPFGTPLFAVASGIVDGVMLGKGAWDSFIRLKFQLAGFGWLWARYAHVSAASVSIGDRVSYGERIGASGNEEGRFGDHLDFSIWRKQAPLTAPSYFTSAYPQTDLIDPLSLLPYAA